MSVVLHHGDCLEVMRRLIEEGVQVHAIVTDPPYGLTSVVKRFGKADSAPALSNGPTGVYARASRGFMGQVWDGTGIETQPETWRLCWELLPPGGHLLAFGGTRTEHRIAAAIEDAGFEIRDKMMWLYGTGFPKSHDVAKSIDKAARGVPHGGAGPGAFMLEPGERSEARCLVSEAQPWEGWGTALKPGWEPIIVARKPLAGTVAANVLAHGVGALNIDGCRVAFQGESDKAAAKPAGKTTARGGSLAGKAQGGGERAEFDAVQGSGRWPANLLHDGSDEVEAAFPGEAHRFFYSSKASAADRAGSKHPTVKPVDLKRWLVRLVTPPGGTVLDPFAGSGTTGAAALAEGFNAVLIEREDQYAADIRHRLGIAAPGGLREKLAALDAALDELLRATEAAA